MSGFAGRLGLALVLAAWFCGGGRAAHAQAAPVGYWIAGWPLGFGGNMAADPASSTYGNFPSFEGADARFGGLSYSRYNFSNGWFVGSERANLGLMGGIGPTSAFGDFGSLSSEGVQFGYSFQNAPVSVYAGFDALKYNPGIGNPFAGFDSSSATLPGYSARAGIEIRPTSNVSLSLGVGYTQQPSGSIGSLPLSGTSPYSLVGHQ